MDILSKEIRLWMDWQWHNAMEVMVMPAKLGYTVPRWAGIGAATKMISSGEV
jgi:hypothetical protein